MMKQKDKLFMKIFNNLKTFRMNKSILILIFW